MRVFPGLKRTFRRAGTETVSPVLGLRAPGKDRLFYSNRGLLEGSISLPAWVSLEVLETESEIKTAGPGKDRLFYSNRGLLEGSISLPAWVSLEVLEVVVLLIQNGQ